MRKMSKDRFIEVLKQIGVGAAAFFAMFIPVLLYKDREPIHIVFAVLGGIGAAYLFVVTYAELFLNKQYFYFKKWLCYLLLTISVLLCFYGATEYMFTLDDETLRFNIDVHGIGVYMLMTMPLTISTYCFGFYLSAWKLKETYPYRKVFPYIAMGIAYFISLIIFFIFGLRKQLPDYIFIIVDMLAIIGLLMLSAIVFMHFIIPWILEKIAAFLSIFSAKGGSGSSSGKGDGKHYCTENDIFHDLYDMSESADGARATVTSVSARGRGSSYALGYNSFDVSVSITVSYKQYDYSTQNYLEKICNAALNQLLRRITSKLDGRKVSYNLSKSVRTERIN